MGTHARGQHPRIPLSTRAITLADREADIYEFMAAAIDQQKEFPDDIPAAQAAYKLPLGISARPLTVTWLLLNLRKSRCRGPRTPASHHPYESHVIVDRPCGRGKKGVVAALA